MKRFALGLLCLVLFAMLSTSVSAQCPGGVCPPRGYSFGRPAYQYRPSYGAYRYQAQAMRGSYRYVYGVDGRIYLTQ